MIGIRIADGSFFPIFDDRKEKKRIILTAANKCQDKVKIDFFKYDDEDRSSGYHIGSLFLDKIGEEVDSEIELTVETDGKKLSAVAVDTSTKTKSILNADIPGFSAKDEIPVNRTNSGMRNLQIMLFVLVLLLAFLTGFIVYTVLNTPLVKETGTVSMTWNENPSDKPAVAEPSVEQPVPDKIMDMGAVPDVPPVPVMPPPPPAPEYIRYRVKYGDTLWSIARDFYHDPYMYKVIARDNRLKSPDEITSGSYLIIRIR